jgi:hypothetical protein
MKNKNTRILDKKMVLKDIKDKVSKKEVKDAIEQAGNSRSKVEKKLK